jgi:hypothetical protein
VDVYVQVILFVLGGLGALGFAVAAGTLSKLDRVRLDVTRLQAEAASAVNVRAIESERSSEQLKRLHNDLSAIRAEVANVRDLILERIGRERTSPGAAR